MSTYFPDSNSATTSGAVRFTLTGGGKPANIACVFGVFFQTPPLGWIINNPCLIAGRQNASTGGNDVFFAVPQACNQVRFRVRNGGSDRVPYTELNGLTAGVKYLLLVVVNPLNFHVIVAPVDGGTPLVSTTATTAPYTQDFNTIPFIDRIGGAGSINGWIGPLEHAFMCHGTFPEVAGVPDDTLIRNLATGAQDINTLDAALTGGSKRFWYPMRTSRNFADAYAVAPDLTLVNETTATGLVLTNGAQLRPEAIRPADAEFVVSQAIFGTAGDAATAAADVPVQGGTYTGITPTAIQARLLKEDGTTHVDWTTIATPAAGVWAAGELPAVPMVAGYLPLQIRAIDGGGQIGEIVSGGARGVGAHFVNAGQSQMGFLHGTGGGLALTANARLVYHRQNNTTHRRALIGSANAAAYGPRRGVRQAANEWNAIYPGVPIQISTVHEDGTNIIEFITGGAHVARWAELRARWGVLGPFYLMPMGHSTGGNSSYEANYSAMIGIADTDLGFPIKVIGLPVSRRSGAGTSLTGAALELHWSRRGMRAWHEANRARSVWGASFQPIETDTASPNPHPQDSDLGQGRSGAIMAWAMMSTCGAVPDEVIGITGATGLGGATHTLQFGRVNNARNAT